MLVSGANQEVQPNDTLMVTVETEPQYSSGMDLSLLRNQYRFYKDATKAPDAELLSWEDHKDILLEAKHDIEKMKQALELSVGLVKLVVDRVMKKYGISGIYIKDSLFQAGMEGLLYGLSKLEDREIKPSSYLVPCIEAAIRTFGRTQKRTLTQE